MGNGLIVLHRASEPLQKIVRQLRVLAVAADHIAGAGRLGCAPHDGAIHRYTWYEATEPRQQSPPSSPSRPARVAPAAPAARHPTLAHGASRRRPAACADCARLARLGEPPVAPADVLA